jgi:hypothetical protein
VAILVLDRGPTPRATATLLAPSDVLAFGEAASLFATPGVLSGADTLALAEATTLVQGTVGGTHEPTDVTLTALIDTTWATEAVDTPWANPSTHGGFTVTTAASNLVVRRLSDQSWLDGGVAAIPAAPSGDDRVLVCRFANNGTASYKGKMFVSVSGVRTLYWRQRVLVSSTWWGNPSGTFKQMSALFQGASNSYIAGPYGANGAGLTFRALLQNTNQNGNWGAGASITRNTWHTWEGLVVVASSAGGADGHVTHWLDGVQVAQRTGVQWAPSGAASMNEIQISNYYGGTANGTGSSFNHILVDDVVVKTSTSRAAVPA